MKKYGTLPMFLWSHLLTQLSDEDIKGGIFSKYFAALHWTSDSISQQTRYHGAVLLQMQLKMCVLSQLSITGGFEAKTG